MPLLSENKFSLVLEGSFRGRVLRLEEGPSGFRRGEGLREAIRVLARREHELPDRLIGPRIDRGERVYAARGAESSCSKGPGAVENATGPNGFRRNSIPRGMRGS